MSELQTANVLAIGLSPSDLPRSFPDNDRVYERLSAIFMHQSLKPEDREAILLRLFKEIARPNLNAQEVDDAIALLRDIIRHAQRA